MVYRGHIKGGVAVIDGAIKLPDGTPVRVEVESIQSDFWQGKTVEQLAIEQGVQPFNGSTNLRADWPDEDNVDEFLALVREARR